MSMDKNSVANDLDFISIPELEEKARSCMPHMAYEFLASGAADEITLRWNRERYDSIALRPRVLREISPPDTGTTLLGRNLPFPFLLAPVAYHGVLHRDAEIATAIGAGSGGATLIVSTNTNTPIEEIAAAASAPLWFQLYVQSDRTFTADVVHRAAASGCEALVVTVDTPTLGPRDRQARSAFRLPDGMTTPHLHDVNSGHRTIMTPARAALTWRDMEWLRSLSQMPIVLKGILDAADAGLAVESGADGIIVSNHGGRNLDTAPATLDALPGVVDRVAGRVPVIVDGGIRRGTDIVKALALGASAVGIGRPYCYGLALGGADGVARVIGILRTELEMAMLLLGVASIGGIDPSVLWSGAAETRR